MELIIHGLVVLTRSLNRRIMHYRRAAPWSYIGLGEYPLALWRACIRLVKHNGNLRLLIVMLDLIIILYSVIVN